MRVALVTPAFPPSIGGVEDHVAQLATHLSSTGIDVEVFTGSRRAETPATPQKRDSIVHRYPAWTTTAMSVSPRLLVRTMHLDNTFDIVHVHSYHASSALAALTGFRRPVVFTPHFHGTGHTRSTRMLHSLYRKFSRALFTSSSAVVCVSDAELELVHSYFPGLDTYTTVIPNGVDAAAVRAATPYPDETATLLFHGRLEPYKRVDRILEAMVELPDTVQLVVVGDGSARNALAASSARLGLGDRVRFTGRLDTPGMHRWLRTADVSVSLSEHEAFGIAPLESAAAGSRIVLSDIPAHREIVRRFLGTGAVLIPPTAGATSIARAIALQLSAGTGDDVVLPDWAGVATATAQVYRHVLRGEP